MILSARKNDPCASCAERILVDLSAAFGHVFSLMEGTIGEASEAESGEALTEKTADACRACGAVFLSDGEAQGVEDLYDALDLPVCVRSFCVPEALCGRHEAPVSLYVAGVLSLDEDTLRQAVHCAFSLAREQDCRLAVIAPTGASKAAWEAAVRVEEAACGDQTAAVMTAPEAAAAIACAPERLGVILCPPYAGSILLAEATALCGHPAVLHDLAFDGKTGVYAPVPRRETEHAYPFSTALALAKLLRFSLGLSREGACLEAAVGNVLAAAGRVFPDADDQMDPEGALEKICEQIAVAGELMSRGGIR